MAQPARGLWAHHDFLRLWAGQTVSQFGEQITTVALPLAAVLVLHATAWDMGVLGAMQILPFVLIGLFLGVYVDRRRRRPLLIAADAVRGAILLVIPVLALIHALRIWDLDAAAFVLGSMTVLFDVSYQSYLPSLVSRDGLVEGNSKLEASRALSQVAGPSVGGMLVGWITAPFALFANVLTYAVSVASLLLIRSPEPQPPPVPAGHTVVSQIREGLRFVLGRADLRSIAGCTSTANLFSSMGSAVLVLFAVHRLGFTPTLLGFAYGGASLGGVAGALAAGRIGHTVGVGRTIAVGSMISAVAGLLVPLTPPRLGIAVPLIVGSYTLVAFGSVIYNITQVTLRQRLTPDGLLGRMNASMRFVVWGSMPVGSLIGGFLGGAIGLRPTLWVAAIGGLCAVIWILRSPVLQLKTQPDPVAVEVPITADA